MFVWNVTSLAVATCVSYEKFSGHILIFQKWFWMNSVLKLNERISSLGEFHHNSHCKHCLRKPDVLFEIFNYDNMYLHLLWWITLPWHWWYNTVHALSFFILKPECKANVLHFHCRYLVLHPLVVCLVSFDAFSPVIVSMMTFLSCESNDQISPLRRTDFTCYIICWVLPSQFLTWFIFSVTGSYLFKLCRHELQHPSVPLQYAITGVFLLILIFSVSHRSNLNKSSHFLTV